jgi:acyl-coenzyme A synthetase/AMP-(fatty) acid ligase
MILVNLSELLPSGRPDELLVADRANAPLTVGSLRRQVAQGVAGLRAKGARRVLLATEDSADFLVMLLATLHAGATAVMPPNTQPGMLAALGGEADLLLTAPLRGSVETPLSVLDAEACRMEFFTSGSTGDRKRLSKTLAQLQREVATLEALWGYSLGQARVLGMVSHQHIFGLTFRLLWPAMAGRPFAAHNHFAWESLVSALHGRNIAVVSPSHLARMEGLAAVPPDRAPLAIFTAGAPVALAAAQQCRTLLGVLPTEIFGSTETGAIAWRHQQDASTTWQALPGTQLSVREGGLLDIRSPNLAAEEVVQSADRVELTPGGFRFAGRADRIVKVEGKRVSLTALEADLAALPGVAEAALGMRGDTLGALLILTPEARASLVTSGRFRFERQLRRTMAATHEPTALPRIWRFLPALPLDPMGKRDRLALEGLLAETAPREPILTALRPGDQAVELDIALPAMLHWFRGHFPGFAVLPGVVQLHWAVLYARRHLGIVAQVGSAQVKFRRPIRPDDHLTLALIVQRNRLNFAYRRGSEICSSGALALPA